MGARPGPSAGPDRAKIRLGGQTGTEADHRATDCPTDRATAGPAGLSIALTLGNAASEAFGVDDPGQRVVVIHHDWLLPWE